MRSPAQRPHMKALTVLQPYAAAIAHATKRIENRGWKPPASVIGQRIAIHAGMKPVPGSFTCLKPSAEVMFRDARPHFDVLGAIVATAVVTGFIESSSEAPSFIQHERWFVPGNYGWILDDVKTLRQPIPCKGFQKLWNVSPYIEAQIELASYIPPTA